MAQGAVERPYVLPRVRGEPAPVTAAPDFGMTAVGQYFLEGYETQAGATATKDLHALPRDHVPGSVNVRHVVSYGNIYKEILEDDPQDQG